MQSEKFKKTIVIIVMEITVQIYFNTIEALLGKCALSFEDDNHCREKAEEFLILTASKNQ